jgi:hypothetical protein
VKRDSYNKFVENLRKNIAEGRIKVNFTFDPPQDGATGESVWALPIGKKYAKINNIPFLVDGVSIDDIVEIQPDDTTHNKEFVRIVSRGSYKTYARYKKSKHKDVLQANYNAFRAHIQKAGGMVEGMVPGIAMIAVPTTMKFEEAVGLLETAPGVLEHGFADMSASDFDIDISSIPDE